MLMLRFTFMVTIFGFVDGLFSFTRSGQPFNDRLFRFDGTETYEDTTQAVKQRCDCEYTDSIEDVEKENI